MLMDKDILNQIYPYIGSDSLKKLLLILKKPILNLIIVILKAVML